MVAPRGLACERRHAPPALPAPDGSRVAPARRRRPLLPPSRSAGPPDGVSGVRLAERPRRRRRSARPAARCPSRRRRSRPRRRERRDIQARRVSPCPYCASTPRAPANGSMVQPERSDRSAMTGRIMLAAIFGIQDDDQGWSIRDPPLTLMDPAFGARLHSLPKIFPLVRVWATMARAMHCVWVSGSRQAEPDERDTREAREEAMKASKLVAIRIGLTAAAMVAASFVITGLLARRPVRARHPRPPDDDPGRHVVRRRRARPRGLRRGHRRLRRRRRRLRLQLIRTQTPLTGWHGCATASLANSRQRRKRAPHVDADARRRKTEQTARRIPVP